MFCTKRILCSAVGALVVLAVALTATQAPKAGVDALGTHKYEEFKTPKSCGACHTDFYQQWNQAMMSRAYTHAWNEVEYFKLALPQAEKDAAVAEVKASCNGCHAPLAYLAGEVPPPRPSLNSRVNESVSCDICHTVIGMAGPIPYNFNWVSSPGKVKYGPRQGVHSPEHETQVSDFLRSPDFCGTCHNQKSPYGAWVMTTHLEYKEGPYFREGVRCQDCHMTSGTGQTALMSGAYPDARQHLFHGAHDPGKVRGTVELRIHPSTREAAPGERVVFTVVLFNQKAGHKFPTGSVEDRIVWMDVEAADAKGRVYHLPVDKKGFSGEEYTLGSDEPAYQDMGIGLGDPGFRGVARDGIPAGDRVFRMAYFDPQGRMTIQQWNTKSLGVDYRIGPRETKIETFTFTLPDTLPPGPFKVTAVLNYRKLIKPVADFLGVAGDESETIRVNDHSTTITILH